jgi:hypothetical protein
MKVNANKLVIVLKSMNLYVVLMTLFMVINAKLIVLVLQLLMKVNVCRIANLLFVIYSVNLALR